MTTPTAPVFTVPAHSIPVQGGEVEVSEARYYAAQVGAGLAIHVGWATLDAQGRERINNVSCGAIRRVRGGWTRSRIVSARPVTCERCLARTKPEILAAFPKAA